MRKILKIFRHVDLLIENHENLNTGLRYRRKTNEKGTPNRKYSKFSYGSYVFTALSLHAFLSLAMFRASTKTSPYPLGHNHDRKIWW